MEAQTKGGLKMKNFTFNNRPVETITNGTQQYFSSINDLLTNNIYPATDLDKKDIEEYLSKGCTLYYDEKYRVFTDTGIYIADIFSSDPTKPTNTDATDKSATIDRYIF